ncbi:formylmethanofuran dehydrogenase subunit C [Chthonobacter rhizosphaerae]|uniref:formylmethanofuran dehydrogenase subunit C n=1 Tax=Chthonobacter rhizosphaerae TaxID=2735553 RepID=UPI0015EF512F|nr:formylmethanofuran dehydrogenase subunit C [Chthonobacter rhizosphaerae]
MAALTFTLKATPPERLDLSALVPARLTGLSAAEIAALAIGSTRSGVTLGDMFDIAGDDPTEIRITGHERLDNVGRGLTGGTIAVDGDVGIYAGRAMKAGTVTVSGSVKGPYLGTAMTGGAIRVAGDAADAVGGAVPGAMHGQAGGLIVVGGSVGDYAGDRMRRGVLVVKGYVGDAAGVRMVGGTIVARALGTRAGLGMKRGTLIGKTVADLEPTFVPTGTYDFPFLALLRRYLETEAPGTGALVPQKNPRRYRGDMAALGKGEIIVD